MTPCKHGQVILVPFPFTDLSTVKQRPALVISSDEFNDESGDVIIAAITSNVDPYRDSVDVYVLSGVEQTQAGLPKESAIRLGKIITLDQRLIRSELGSLPSKTLTTVTKIIHKIV